MRRPERLLRGLMLALGGLISFGAAAPDDECQALARLTIPDVSIEAAVSVGLAGGSACRVTGVARPVTGSRIGFEVWLPDPERWNGRYYQLGSGGFAGSIHRPSLAEEARRGNAAASTDTGHRADPFDARWAIGNPVALVDYGHRSIKATSDAAAALIRAYYGRPARRRYFAGCSNGGRQALMAAQRYPDDWDGILAGAPANSWTRQLATFMRLQQRLRSDRAAWLSPQDLAFIQRAALAACPARARDGAIATDPEACRLDIASLVCRRGGPRQCLTGAQAESLRQIVAGGYQPTSAAGADGWASWIVNPDRSAPSQLSFAEQARLLFAGGAPPLWLRRALDADDPDFARFRARGGRLISYFGWADPLLSPGAGLDYYRRVAARLGGLSRVRAFYRLFMVPGMAHCQGGDGPDSFGQSMVSPPLIPDARHDIRIALEHWVERGEAPTEIVAIRAGSATGPSRTLRSQ